MAKNLKQVKHLDEAADAAQSLKHVDDLPVEGGPGILLKRLDDGSNSAVEAAAIATNVAPFKAGVELDLTGASVGFTKQTYTKGVGYVYLLLDQTTGEIFKVGKTSGGVNIYQRLNMYRRKSQEYGYKVTATFWEVGTERAAFDLEGQIRRKLKVDGNRLPWDKAANPGRSDLGLPWERSASTPFEIEN